MEDRVLALFFICFTLQLLIELGLNELNLRHVRARRSPEYIPGYFRNKMNLEEYRRSIEYTLAKGRFQRWADIYGKLVLLIVLLGGVLPFIDRLSQALAQAIFSGGYFQGILFCLGVALVVAAAGLPTDLYVTFGLESRFGFNHSTWKLYLADKLKGVVLGLVIGGPFLLVVLWLMGATGSYWWIWAFVFITGFQLLMVIVFPTLIAPLFNKFEPLREGELRDRILQMAGSVGFKTNGIYSMDGSKRSAHSNAYFTGMGRAKRIVLFDTLIEQMTIDQGLAVLAHEMGHYKLKHIRRMLLVQTSFLFVGLYVLSLLLDYRPLFSAFGLAQPSHHGALVLFSLLAGPFTFPLGPLMNHLSRKHEYEADRFAAATLGNGRPMEEALINLTVKNLANLTPHPWYSAYHYSHPTPTERIAAIRQTST